MVADVSVQTGCWCLTGTHSFKIDRARTGGIAAEKRVDFLIGEQSFFNLRLMLSVMVMVALISLGVYLTRCRTRRQPEYYNVTSFML